MIRLGRRFPRNSVHAVTLGIAVILAGCGGGDDGSSAEESAELPEPQQSISEQIPVFERATSQLSCEDAVQVVNPVLLAQPESPESRRNCKDALFYLRSTGEFRATDSEELGTAAIVDGEAGGADVALVFALDAERSFKYIGGSHPRPQVGTDPPANVDFERNAVAFIEAMREDDCKAAHAVLVPRSRLYYSNEKEFCRFFERNYTAPPEGFGSRLQEDPDTELVELGATHDLAFFGVATEPAGYRTIVMSVFEGSDPLVFDVVPVER